MNTKEYNGWTNYETWLVKLWMDNDQGEQTYWQDEATECVRIHGTDNDNESARVLADIMKEHYDEAASELSGVTGFWADLLNGALSEVNWREIAQHWIEEVEKDVA